MFVYVNNKIKGSMADNTIIIGGATQPSTINTPSDKRERVETFDKNLRDRQPCRWWYCLGGRRTEGIPYHFLKPKVIGGMEIADGAVNEVVPEAEILSRSLKADTIASGIAEVKRRWRPFRMPSQVNYP